MNSCVFQEWQLASVEFPGTLLNALQISLMLIYYLWNGSG